MSDLEIGEKYVLLLGWQAECEKTNMVKFSRTNMHYTEKNPM